MVLIRFVTSLRNFYNDRLDHSDPRVRSWPMVDKDFLNFSIIAFYLLFVLFIGPRFMKNRKAFDLRKIMVPYNIALVAVNFYIFLQFVRLRYFTDADTGCIPLRVSQSPHAFQLAEITWWYYLTKYIELSDTVFFVLRKKDYQLSRLHLVHHSTIPLVIWALLRFEPGGYNTFFPQANAFVHCVMYVYYTMAAFEDDGQEHEALWFKKYVTMTQMVQFVIVLLYFFSRPLMGCNVSLEAFITNVFIAGFFFVLFCNFYYHAYVLNEDEKRRQNGFACDESESVYKNGSESTYKNGSEAVCKNGSESLYKNGSELTHRNGSRSAKSD